MSTTIEPGQKWRDLDYGKRLGIERIVTVVRVGDTHVTCSTTDGRGSVRRTSIARKSFHNNPDRAAGFVLVPAPPTNGDEG